MVDNGTKNLGAMRVMMFPRLVITDGSVTMDEEEIRSDMVVKLLSYLVFYHKKSCTSGELSSVLWSKEESANPSGALKNLAYRLRSSMKKAWPDRDFILTGRGSYRWNPEIPVSLDAEEFQYEIRKGDHSEDPYNRIRHFMRAFSLYKGKFLSSLESEHWVMPKAARFETAYLDLSRKLTDLLFETGQHEEMKRVAASAIEIEPYDEFLHGAYIRACIAQKEMEEAEEHYRITEKLLYDNLGIGPSEELKKIFDSVMERDHEVETDLAVIQMELKEATRTRGAYYCEYGVFKKIYELEARRVARMGMTIYLSLLTVCPNRRSESGSDERELIENAMEQVLDAVMDSLRAGDVLARYSANQYLVMLPACPYENARMVMDRIVSNFEKLRRHARVHLQYSLKEMDNTPEGSHGNPLKNPSSLRLLIDSLGPDRKEIKGSIVGIALKTSYSFEGTHELMHLVEQLLNRIGRPQPGRLSRSFGHDEKYVSYNAAPEIFREVEEIETERGAAATYDVEFRSRLYSTWQGLIYGEGYDAAPFSSELELVSMICTGRMR